MISYFPHKISCLFLCPLYDSDFLPFAKSPKLFLNLVLDVLVEKKDKNHDSGKRYISSDHMKSTSDGVSLLKILLVYNV